MNIWIREIPGLNNARFARKLFAALQQKVFLEPIEESFLSL